MSVGIAQNLIYASYIPAAWSEIRRHSQHQDTKTGWDVLSSQVSLPVSIVVPAYNEANTIVENVSSLLALRYPDFELIVVNDGSTDGTMDRVIERFGLVPTARARDDQSIAHTPVRGFYRSPIHPSLLVVDKANGGKADAMNVGLCCVRTPLFCVIDADSVLEPDALIAAVRPFMESSGNVIAVGGTVSVANGCTIRNGQVVKYGLPPRFLPRMQVLEYVRAFLMARLADSRSGTLALISGAFGIFRTDVAMAVGGYDRTTLGEDLEMVLKLHRHMRDGGISYQIRNVPDPVAWTEAPATLRYLSRQRIRWQRGVLECLSRHRTMLFNPKYGRIGMITLPTMVLVDLVGPIAECLGYLVIPLLALAGVLSQQFFLAYVALVFLFGVFLSASAVLLEQAELERVATPRDIVSLTLAAIVENFGYRQLCNAWRIIGLYRHFRGVPAKWGAMERAGFGSVNPSGQLGQAVDAPCPAPPSAAAITSAQV